MKTRMISRIAVAAIVAVSASLADQRQTKADETADILNAVGQMVSGIVTAANGQQGYSTGGGYVQVPRLGFNSFFNGHGEQVTGVAYGSRASQVGLEPGDVIMAVSGYHLRYQGAWYDGMRRAVQQGHITLAIRDWRTGRIVYRHVNLGGQPITAKAPSMSVFLDP